MGSAIIIVFLLSILLAALWGYFRGWKRSLVRLGTTVVGLILAIVLTYPIGAAVLEPLTPMIDSFLASEGFRELTEGSPTFFYMLENFPRAIIYPLIFLVLFYVIKTLLLIAHAIIANAIDKREDGEKPDTPSRWIGVSIGVGQGIICAFATVIVLGGIMGIVTNANDAFQTIENEGFTEVKASMKQVNAEVAEPITTNIITRAYMACGGEALFNSFADIDIDGEKVRLDKELKYILPFLMEFTEVTTKPEHTTAELEHLNKSMKKVSESVISTKIVHELFVHIATEWLSDAHFMGITNPAIGKEYENDFNTALEIIKDSQPQEVFDNIKELLNTMGIEIFDDIAIPDGIGDGEVLPPDWFE